MLNALMALAQSFLLAGLPSLLLLLLADTGSLPVALEFSAGILLLLIPNLF